MALSHVVAALIPQLIMRKGSSAQKFNHIVTSVVFTLAAMLVATGGIIFVLYGLFHWLLESGTTVSGAALLTGLITLLSAVPIYLFGRSKGHTLEIQEEEEASAPRSALEELMLAFASGFMASPDKTERTTETATGRDEETGERVSVVRRTKRVEHPGNEDETPSMEVRTTSRVTPLKSSTTLQ